MAHVADWKKTEVGELTGLLNDIDVIGIVGVNGIAARQMQMMRANLRSQATLRVVKNRLLKLALDRCTRDNIDGLDEFVDGQIALIACMENPFKLFRVLENTKTPAPAKGGDLAPYDISVEKGETSFKPGPIIAELQRAGFPAAIEKGKVVFKKNKIIVKKGDEISESIAGLLTKLEIYPMVVGLSLRGVYDSGEIILPEVLDIDLEGFVGDLGAAARNAMALAMSVAYVNDVTLLPLLQKAHLDCMALAVSRGIASPKTLPHIISKAYSEMLGLAQMVSPDGLDDDIRGIMAGRAAAAPSSEPVVESTPAEEVEEEEVEVEEEEEATEEEAVSGLGALFG